MDVTNETPTMKQVKKSSSLGLLKTVLMVFIVIVLIGLSTTVYDAIAQGRFNISSLFDVAKNSQNQNDSANDVQVKEVIRVVDEESATISVVERTSPSVVSVLERSVTFNFFSGPQTRESSIGTGFVIEEALVVTNKHVVSDTSAEYTIVDNAGERHEVTEIYRDPLNDLAILKITEDQKFEALELGDSDEIRVGQTVIAIGNALGRFSNTVTKGVISGKGRGISTGGSYGQYVEEIDNVLQTDAALNPGNSGGPLLNIDGQVIGVNVAVGVGTENIGFAIPVNTLKELVEDFTSGVDRRRPFLGITYTLLTPEMIEGSNTPQGAYVREVIRDSAAFDAGIRVNDVIVEFEGTLINATNTLASEISKFKVGDTVDLKIWRDGKTLEVEVKLKAAAE
jgi:S1-C subfamily serine protease